MAAVTPDLAPCVDSVEAALEDVEGLCEVVADAPNGEIIRIECWALIFAVGDGDVRGEEDEEKQAEDDPLGGAAGNINGQ